MAQQVRVEGPLAYKVHRVPDQKLRICKAGRSASLSAPIATVAATTSVAAAVATFAATSSTAITFLTIAARIATATPKRGLPGAARRQAVLARVQHESLGMYQRRRAVWSLLKQAVGEPAVREHVPGAPTAPIVDAVTARHAPFPVSAARAAIANFSVVVAVRARKPAHSRGGCPEQLRHVEAAALRR